MKKDKSNVPSLDLHGATEAEVFDLVDRFLTKQNAPTVRIISGKGKGIVKKKLIEYLKLARYTWTFEKLPNGSQNEGVLIVQL